MQKTSQSLLLSFLAFAILGSYEIARPAAESIFLSQHQASALPGVWLLVAVAVTFTVSFYNLFSARVPLPRLMAACSLISALSLLGVQGALKLKLPGTAYALYLWKDLYIVILIELFWTLSNTLLELKSARWLYGLFCAAGSLGAISGARSLRFFMNRYGWETEEALWLLLPIFLLVAGLALLLKAGKRPTQETSSDWREGFKVLKGSRYLLYLLLLILSVQWIITLVDYQFNSLVEQLFAQEKERTFAISRVYEYINYGALLMQLLTGLILKGLKVTGVMAGIPLIIGGSLLALLFNPGFLFAAVAKISGKVLDYSLFRAAKELLYLPMNYSEKTQGKALVDMLSYRLAKGGVALLLQGLLALGAVKLLPYVTLVQVVIWGLLVWLLLRQYHLRLSKRRNDEADL